MPTPEPGLYADIPMLEYHTWEGASQSRLKVIRDQSPAHLRWQMDHPSPPSDAQAVGSAVHTAVLEPELFASSYDLGPTKTRGTQAWIAEAGHQQSEPTEGGQCAADTARDCEPTEPEAGPGAQSRDDETHAREHEQVESPVERKRAVPQLSVVGPDSLQQHGG